MAPDATGGATVLDSYRDSWVVNNSRNVPMGATGDNIASVGNASNASSDASSNNRWPHQQRVLYGCSYARAPWYLWAASWRYHYYLSSDHSFDAAADTIWSYAASRVVSLLS
jgi:hypothetical protein